MDEKYTGDNLTKGEMYFGSRETYQMVVLRGVVVFPGQTYTVDVGRDKSLQALNRAMETNKSLFVVTQKNRSAVNPAPKDIYRVGTLVKIKQIIRTSAEYVRAVVEGVERMEIDGFVSILPFYEVSLKKFAEEESDPLMLKAVRRNLFEQLDEYRKFDSKSVVDLQTMSTALPDDEKFIAVSSTVFFSDYKDRQELLSQNSVYKQLEFIYKKVVEECELKAVEKRIATKVRMNIDKNQREYYVREQIKVLRDELGEGESEFDEYKKRIEEKDLPSYAKEKLLKELSRMEKMSVTSPEASVSRTYIDLVLSLPWNECSKDNRNLKKAEKILDEDHYGLEKIKQRIVEYLAVHTLTENLKAPILCFVGPPGVGKTSIVASIARATDRKLVTMSLGGVRDEAEIRGHRRTYVGALPGRIISGMKNAQAVNPVFLLDEIDKMTSDFRGDPSSAMLEVLDPNQNFKFSDNYLDMPYDLSKVMFVTTANTVDTIPTPLLDRMEILELSGYTYEEKLQIAKKYLLPKQIEANGLSGLKVTVPDEVMSEIISRYTRESGVRNLEREIASVVRKLAVKYVNRGDKEIKSFKVTKKDLAEYLGAPKYKNDSMNTDDEVGLATGLAWTSVGGTTLNIEVSLISGGKGEIKLTGSLGDVMKESCHAALTVIRSRAEQYGIEQDKFTKYDLHIHVPEGATPKDGPSAGITIATAIMSAMSGRKVSKNVAMTGEITLRGKVLPIGGLKEKSLAAFRSGVRTIIIPRDNEKDVADLPSEVKDNMTLVYADTIDDVFGVALI